MPSRSIRWQLPLSYGAIALLATFFLTALLLFTLRRYYAAQERSYLTQNAQAISNLLASSIALEDVEVARTQVETFAFLTQTRVKLVAPDGEVIVDTGAYADEKVIVGLSLVVESDNVRQAFSQTIGGESNGRASNLETAVIVDSEGQSIRSRTTVSSTLDTGQTFLTPLALLSSPIGPAGFGIDGRSSEEVRVPVRDFRGQPFGWVELSEGPAYGRAVVISVALAALAAGGVAIVATTLLGYWFSGRLSRPLLDVAAAARRMAAGDLAARSTVSRADEIGEVAGAFNVMAGQIEETVGTLRRFMADAAHELNTPLTALRTHLELAEGKAPDNPHLAPALAQSERLTRLTDDLLRLARLESEPLSAAVAVDWRALLAEQSEWAAARAEQAGLAFNLMLPEEALLVQGRPEHLRRLVDNLLDNAVKFTPSGGEVTVVLRVVGETAVLCVSDSGIGFSGPGDHLFARFHRGQNAGDYPGSGLGLAIARRIAEQHGGGVAAESDSGGATFTVTLPLLG